MTRSPSRRWRRTLPLALVAVLGATAACSGGSDKPPPVVQMKPGPQIPNGGATREDPLAGTKPNILFITVDDMAPRDLKWMPKLRKLVGDEGTTHTNAITPTPICAPSRASWMSGQYATNHGVHTVDGPASGFASFDENNRLPSWLQSAGYQTGFLGKYLNGYGVEDPTYVPPGWTDWRGSVDMATYDFSQVRLNRNGKVWEKQGYQTPIFAAQGNDMINKFVAAGKPWFLNLNYVAPHHGGPQEPGDPAPDTTVGGRFKLHSPAVEDKYRGLFGDLPMPDQPDQWKQTENTGNPPVFTPEEREEITNVWRQRLESLQSVDDAVASHLQALKDAGQLDQTLVVFMSDNGMSMGEHNRIGKLAPWYESLEVPLLVRGPGVARGVVSNDLVTNADLPVTFAALAGIKPPVSVDGIDIGAVWAGARMKTRSVPLAAWAVKDQNRQIWSGVRVDDTWTFARPIGGRRMMFDRAADPYETVNVFRDSQYRAERKRLTSLARKLQKCAGVTCQTVVWAPDKVQGKSKGN